MILAARTATHVYDFTRIGDRSRGISPLQRPPIIPTHGLDNMSASGVLTISNRAVSAETEGIEQTGISCGGGEDPFIVGVGQARWVIDEGPHY